MKQLESLTKRSKETKLSKNSKLYKTVIKAIQDKKGENIVVLDLRKIPEAVADFFIICEGTSTPQIRAIASEIEDKVKEECGEGVFHKEGFQNLQWVLMDYVNIVTHIMMPEPRAFYSLEEMWSDASREEMK